MKRVQSRFLSVSAAAVIFFLAGAASSPAQTNANPARITQAIDEHSLTVLSGNTHPLARPEFDRGPAPAALPMERMLLVLKRSPQQETALETLLEQQQNGASPSYHHWLTPQQFGQQFGPADKDIQTITQWLQAHGFQVAGASNGRTTIEFSGTASEVQEAFHTAIHQYHVYGQDYWANSSDPQIPAALAPVVVGVNTLYNFPRQAMHETTGVFTRSKATGMVTPANPQYTFPNPCSTFSQPLCNFALAPADFAKIYDVPNLALLPAPKTVYNGDGTTIAIVAESNINPQDFANFRSFFGLPAGNLNVILNGPDPGIILGPETEADLDTQWAGAVAPNATIDLVVSGSTETSLGPDLSAEYAIDNNLAPILSESFGLCEFYLGTAGNAFYSQLWQQAAAQGITVTISSGDQGSAVCDYGQTAASHGLSVNGFASTPYNIAVGGTDFNDLNNFAQFWNTNPSTSTTQPSALGYIPEMTWNDSCTNQEIPAALQLGNLTAEQTCNSALVQQYGFVTVTGGSGGKSNCTSSDGQNLTSCSGSYPKPAWQTSLTPRDSARDVPDVSLFASNGFNGSFYIVCELDQTQYALPGTPPCNPNTPNSAFLGLGGTSASTPAFAGMMALINQATSSRQGNANYILYALAAKTGATCKSAANPASSCVFYDIPAGSTIAMPCKPSTPNCTVIRTGDQYGVLSGFSTSAGYDLATGLGSVNAANLISQWASFVLNLKPSTTALTLTPLSGGSLTTLVHGQTVTVSTSVAAGQGATGTPTGNVSLLANTGPNGQEGVQGLILSNGSASGTTNALPGGTYTVQAQYAGDGTFSSSASSGTSVTVAPEASKATIAYELFDPVTGAQTSPSATTAVFGTPSLLRVNVASQAGDACVTNAPGANGCPTGSITLTDSYNGGTAALLDGGTFKLNSEGYTEDQAIDLPGGTHNLAAAYPGDSSFNATNANGTLTITPVPTTNVLFPNSNTEIFGQSTSLSVVVAAQNIFSSIAPTGTVTFYSGTTALGNSQLSGSVNPNTHQMSAGANLTTTSLPHGQDSITAQYSGDASYAASPSPAQTITVLYQTAMSLTYSKATITVGTPVTFAAQVTTSQTGGPAITGTVQFLANGLSLSSPVVSNGQAQINTSSLPSGTYRVYAYYSGDTNYAAASGSFMETVNTISTTTSVTSSNSTISQGSSVTFTAMVTPGQSGGPAMTGNVQFFSNNVPIGSAGISNGQAEITTTSLPAGSDQITATYMGDSNYSTSTSSAITETVNAVPTFTIAAYPSTITISAPGQSGSTMLTFTSQNGFSGSATLTSSACMGLPSESSCGFSPSSITIPSNGAPTTTTLTILTTAPSAALPTATHRQNPGSWLGTGGVIALAFFLALGLAALWARGSQRRWAAAFALIALAFVFANAGCGGGSGGGGITNPGTPAPSNTPVTVTITINGVTQTVPVTVVVQ